MSNIVVAALQIGSDYRGTAATLDHVLSFEDRIAASGAKLVVMPEALLGGYPKGEDSARASVIACPRGVRRSRAITTLRSTLTGRRSARCPA